MKKLYRHSRFQRERLPAPAAFFQANAIELIGRGAWQSALCPFHADQSPSLRIHVESGAFRCMACGAKGGDVLSFVQQRDGLSFKQAAQQLGAWADK